MYWGKLSSRSTGRGRERGRERGSSLLSSSLRVRTSKKRNELSRRQGGCQPERPIKKFYGPVASSTKIEGGIVMEGPFGCCAFSTVVPALLSPGVDLGCRLLGRRTEGCSFSGALLRLSRLRSIFRGVKGGEGCFAFCSEAARGHLISGNLVNDESRCVYSIQGSRYTETSRNQLPNHGREILATLYTYYIRNYRKCIALLFFLSRCSRED